MLRVEIPMIPLRREPAAWEPIPQDSPRNSYQNASEPVTIYDVPISVVRQIFSFFATNELRSSSCACRAWRKIGSTNSLWDALDIKKEFPQLKIIDGETWMRHLHFRYHAIDVSDAPSLEKHKRETLIAVGALYSLKTEENNGVTLLTVPKGLDESILAWLAKTPKPGNYSVQILRHIQFEESFYVNNSTKIVAMTNSVLLGSRGLNIHEQFELLESKGCSMPTFLAAASLAVLTYMSSASPPAPPIHLLHAVRPTRLFSNCYTHTVDYGDVVGNFQPTGTLEVTWDEPPRWFKKGGGDPRYGVSAMVEIPELRKEETTWWRETCCGFWSKAVYELFSCLPCQCFYSKPDIA